MKITALAAVALLLFLIVLGAIKAPGKGERARPKARRPLTKNEQPMYFRLQETFPEHLVLAQVAFSALLTSDSRGTRNMFDRKVADFVLCTKAFEVTAVIELDDYSHKGRRAADAARDKLLVDAGYRVLRFKRTPDAVELQAALAMTITAESNARTARAE